MAMRGLLTAALVRLGSLPGPDRRGGGHRHRRADVPPATAALLVAFTPENEQVMVFAVYRMAFNLSADRLARCSVLC